MLAGFMSRWMMPAAWATSSASEISMPNETIMHLHGLAGDIVLQRRPFQEFHRNESLAFKLANVVDSADVGMVQRRGGPGFAPETGQRVGVLRYIWREELERDKTAEAHVLGFVHHPHAATAQLLDNAVV